MNNTNNNTFGVRRTGRKPVRNKGRGSQQLTQANLVAKLNTTRVPGATLIRGPYPQSETVKCTYTFTQNPAGAVTFEVIDLRANSIWQPLVGGATATVSGYTGSAARYASYRVEATRFRYRVANNEAANSLTFGMIGNDTQPSTIVTTYQQAFTALGSSRSFSRDTVGYTAGLSIFRSVWFKTSPGQLVGDPMMVYSDRDFSASFGANPNQVAWLGFIVMSESAGVNITAGCYVTFEVEYVTRNFGPLLLA